MDETDDGVGHVGREPAAEETGRARFHSESRKLGAFFADLERTTIVAHENEYGLSLHMKRENDSWSWVPSFIHNDQIARCGINRQTVRDIGREFDIKDTVLLLAVLVLALEQGRTTPADHVFLWDRWNCFSGVPSAEDCDRLRHTQDLAIGLERDLNEQTARAASDPISKFLVEHPTAQTARNQLLEALATYRRVQSKFDVIEFRKRKGRPPYYQQMGICNVLVPMWPRLTGSQPTSWDARPERGGKKPSRFYQFLQSVCELAGLKCPDTDTVDGWLKHMPGKKPPRSDD